jgi:hypothetical protein
MNAKRKAIRLTRDEVRVLALCLPGINFSQPYQTNGSDPALSAAWKRLEDRQLLDGAPGCYWVRWGLLSTRQYDRVLDCAGVFAPILVLGGAS